MCGIIGYFNIKDHKKQASEALSKIVYRGLDNQDSYSGKDFTFAHCLHSVVENKPQPIIKDEFIFGANCELYNWKELANKHRIAADNDADLLLQLLIKNIKNKKPTEKLLNNILKELDGVFSFFLHNRTYNYTLLARDVLGEKPLWFHHDKKSFIFASERKAIASEKIEPEELNPRKIILYNNRNKKLTFFHQDFFKITRSEKHLKELPALMKEAIKKRIPDKNLGLLFSGGLDSTFLAFMLKELKVPFKAYMTVDASKKDEIENAEKIARQLNFPLKIVGVTKEQVKKELPKVIQLIETADPVKVEVGLVMHFALKEAKKDKIKVIFSGLGADDIFAGYKRMYADQDVSLDSLSSLRRIYERDLYRDDVLSMSHNIELRLPYLDRSLVQACLNIPNELKVAETPKNLLRNLARKLGLPEELTTLKRNAAQYSSGIGKLTAKILREHKEKFKGRYFSSILKRKNIRLGALFSSGKDSVYALHIMHRLNYDISCLITIASKNKDSYMFHTPAVNLAKHQARALGIPLIMQTTAGKKEIELKDLKKAITKAKEKYNIQGIITGALFSNYQRTRIEELCDKLNLKCYSPLWHMNQETEVKNLIDKGFKFVMTKVAAEGLDKSWLGQVITNNHLEQLKELNNKLNINIAGEGGEFETFVLDAPLFKEDLRIEKSHIIEEKQGTATLIIDKVSSKKK